MAGEGGSLRQRDDEDEPNTLTVQDEIVQNIAKSWYTLFVGLYSSAHTYLCSAVTSLPAGRVCGLLGVLHAAL